MRAATAAPESGAGAPAPNASFAPIARAKSAPAKSAPATSSAEDMPGEEVLAAGPPRHTGRWRGSAGTEAGAGRAGADAGTGERQRFLRSRGATRRRGGRYPRRSLRAMRATTVCRPTAPPPLKTGATPDAASRNFRRHRRGSGCRGHHRGGGLRRGGRPASLERPPKLSPSPERKRVPRPSPAPPPRPGVTRRRRSGRAPSKRMTTTAGSPSPASGSTGYGKSSRAGPTTTGR